MAEAPAEQREEVGPRPTLDLTASASSSPEGGFSFSVSLKITNKWLAAGALAGIGLAALLYKHPEIVTKAVRSALEGPGLQVGDIAPGSLVVELHCNMKESLLSFMKDFKTKKVKQRLEQEFQKVGFKVELEVTIITNDKEVYEKLDQKSQPLPSDLSGPNQYVDYCASSTSPESLAKLSIASSNPNKLAEDLDGSSFNMSGIVESPMSKYGRSSEFGVVLDFIQTMIRNDTLRQAFNIPHLVMVGRQNMAKTTLINRLIGRYLLPMRRDETANILQARTTYPIILNLRKGEKTIVEVKCDKYPDIGGVVENPTDDMVEEFLKKVASHLPKEQGTLISKTPVNVTLQGPDLTTLTLVDLPGAHFANDDPRMNQVTQSLVLDYIKKNTKSIIIIVSEVGDPTGDSAINLVMQEAADFRSRTICVLTKPDRLRESDDMGRKVALNQSSFTLEDGRFILLRGKDGTDAIEKDWDAEMTRLKEKEWFERHPQYKGIQHLCGIDRLMEAMISLLAQKMITEIPILVRQMRERKTMVEEELKRLADSEIPESSEGKGALVMKVKQNLITQLKTLLFNNTSDIAGGEQVRELFNKFQEAIYKVDPLALRSDEDIRRQQGKLEGVEAPLGDSSENSQLLQKLLYEKYQEIREIPSVAATGILGVNSTGFQGRMLTAVETKDAESPVDQLIPITEGLVDSVEKALRKIVQGAINQSLHKFPSLKQAVEAKVVSKMFDTKREQTIQFIRQFLEMQKKSIDDVLTPVPFPDELSTWEATTTLNNKIHPCMVSPTMRHLKDLSKKLYPKELIDEIEGGDKHGNYKELEDMRKVKKNVVRCFNVLKMNVCDTVPRCILHFFITQLVDDLEGALEQEDLVEFLKEKKEIRDRRILCRAQFLALKQALPHTDDVLQKLLRMRDRSSAGENLQF